MKIKTKIAIALLFLFGAILSIMMLGVYYVDELETDAENILRNNYESLQYTHNILMNCDSLSIDSARALRVIESNTVLQEQNVTEKGEQELTLQLRKVLEKMSNAGINTGEIGELRRLCFGLQDLNMKAIVAKNEITMQTGRRASSYLMIIGSIISLIAFTFIINFPGYVANPIAALTGSIKSIADKNYEERLHFDRKDEFRELADAFNLMAERMDEYEHSNLAKILFEKKRIETIINRMSDPVLGLDELKTVVFANDQALSLLNLAHDQIIGRYAPDVAVENDLFRNLIRTSERGIDVQPGLVKVVVNGKENYFSKENIVISYQPTGETVDVAIGEVILLKNVTPFKELDLAKTNFIATISHELKTPIASLQMGIKLLHDNRVGTLNEEQVKIAQTLMEETTRLNKITHELLDLAQVESGNIKLSIQRIDPRDVILYALEAVKFHAERRNVHIEVEQDRDLPHVMADMDKTTWVLVNLLTNAIRYSPENEKVVLRCSRVDGRVLFSVRDFGAGIESKYVGRLFEKFFQVPGTPSGTGLGLAISKEFIEAQKGSIAVKSEPGHGSEFSFRLAEG